MTECDWRISKGVGVKQTRWWWVCWTHRYDCPKHMTVFMAVPVYDRQLELTA